jgi:hypothetical protein
MYDSSSFINTMIHSSPACLRKKILTGNAVSSYYQALEVSIQLAYCLAGIYHKKQNRKSALLMIRKGSMEARIFCQCKCADKSITDQSL